MNLTTEVSPPVSETTQTEPRIKPLEKNEATAINVDDIFPFKGLWWRVTRITGPYQAEITAAAPTAKMKKRLKNGR